MNMPNSLNKIVFYILSAFILICLGVIMHDAVAQFNEHGFNLRNFIVAGLVSVVLILRKPKQEKVPDGEPKQSLIMSSLRSLTKYIKQKISDNQRGQ